MFKIKVWAQKRLTMYGWKVIESNHANRILKKGILPMNSIIGYVYLSGKWLLRWVCLKFYGSMDGWCCDSFI